VDVRALFHKGRLVVRRRARLFRRCIAGVVRDVGGGRDRAPRPFGHRAVMIACARAHDHFGAAGPVCQRCKVPPALIGAARGVFGGVAPLDL
jgi:hypothetical protein